VALVIDRFHQSQNDIRIEEAGWTFDDFNESHRRAAAVGQDRRRHIQTTPDLVLRLVKAASSSPSRMS